MAEAKSQTKTTTTNKKAAGNDQWKAVLEATRESYMNSLKSLTKMQEETEKLISNLANKGKSLQEENIKVVKSFIENGIKSRDEFKQIFEDSYKKVLSLFEGLNVGDVQFPFKAQFDEMMKAMEENMKKYFKMPSFK